MGVPTLVLAVPELASCCRSRTRVSDHLPSDGSLTLLERDEGAAQTLGLSMKEGSAWACTFCACRPRGQQRHGSWPWESSLASTEPLKPWHPMRQELLGCSAVRLQPEPQTAPWRSQSHRSSAAGVCHRCSPGTARGSLASGRGWQPPAGMPGLLKEHATAAATSCVEDLKAGGCSGLAEPAHLRRRQPPPEL